MPPECTSEVYYIPSTYTPPPRRILVGISKKVVMIDNGFDSPKCFILTDCQDRVQLDAGTQHVFTDNPLEEAKASLLEDLPQSDEINVCMETTCYDHSFFEPLDGYDGTLTVVIAPRINWFIAVSIIKHLGTVDCEKWVLFTPVRFSLGRLIQFGNDMRQVDFQGIRLQTYGRERFMFYVDEEEDELILNVPRVVADELELQPGLYCKLLYSNIM